MKNDYLAHTVCIFSFVASPMTEADQPSPSYLPDEDDSSAKIYATHKSMHRIGSTWRIVYQPLVDERFVFVQDMKSDKWENVNTKRETIIFQTLGDKKLLVFKPKEKCDKFIVF